MIHTEEIVICPFCCEAYPAEEINVHAETVHFATQEASDRLVAEYLQRQFNAEQRATVKPARIETDNATTALKVSLQQKLRGLRAQEDEEMARRLQEEYDRENVGMGPAADYVPVPMVPSAYPAPKEWLYDAHAKGYALRCLVLPKTAEFDSVTKHLYTTLGCSAKVHRLERIQNPTAYARFVATCGTQPQKYFFHGCRSAENENSIIHKGFDVRKAVSGGKNYGTWFAAVASYSNSGFAYVDEKSVHHLFISCVCTASPVMRQHNVIVVKENRAYPSYVVMYTCESDGGPHMLQPAVPTVPAGLATYLKSTKGIEFSVE